MKMALESLARPDPSGPRDSSQFLARALSVGGRVRGQLHVQRPSFSPRRPSPSRQPLLGHFVWRASNEAFDLLQTSIIIRELPMARARSLRRSLHQKIHPSTTTAYGGDRLEVAYGRPPGGPSGFGDRAGDLMMAQLCPALSRSLAPAHPRTAYSPSPPPPPRSLS